MGIFDLFKRKPEITIDDEFHAYVHDIAQLNKQRDGLMQKLVLTPQGTQEFADFRAELRECNTMIACAQKAIIDIKERAARKAAQ